VPPSAFARRKKRPACGEVAGHKIGEYACAVPPQEAARGSIRGAPPLGATTPSDRTPRVLVVGGGFGGMMATRLLAHADVEVTLLDRNTSTVFAPVLYQCATGPTRVELAGQICELATGRSPGSSGASILPRNARCCSTGSTGR
jgi:hypothetical protein